MTNFLLASFSVQVMLSGMLMPNTHSQEKKGQLWTPGASVA